MKNTAVLLFFCLAVFFPLFGDEREELTLALRKELQKYEGNIDFAVVASLLKAGADPNGRCEDGRPFLAQVIQTHGGRQVIELTELLLDHGALVDTVNEKGETILWSMVDREENDRIAILLRRGANPNKQNASGDTPLMAAHTDAMTAAMRLGLRYKEMLPLRDLVSQYASAGEISEAKKAAAKTVGTEKNNRLHNALSVGLPPTFIALLFPLVFGGLSILMREKLFAYDKSKNPMGQVNALLTLCASGGLIGFLMGASSFKSSGAWGDMFGPFLYGVFAGTVGLFAGAILAFLPPIRKAFTNIPVLYYSLTALSVIAAGVFIFIIWRY